jgi:hypothetical protein
MYFVAKCDIDGLCQHGQILNINELSEILMEATTAEVEACNTLMAAEIWAEIILEEIAERTAK